MTIARNVALLRATLLGGALLLAAAAPAFADSLNRLPSENPGTAPTSPAVQQSNTDPLQGQINVGPFIPLQLETPTPPPGQTQRPGGIGVADIAVTYAGPTADGFDRFTVANIGTIPAETFHVAVLSLSNSYGLDIPYLDPNESKTYTLPFNDCQTGAVILANTGNTVKESNYSNDSLVLNGTCPLDGDSVPVPARN